jgi:hypothetical protein
MSYATDTFDQLITDLRSDLDEPLDTASNFWTDGELAMYLNAGTRQVWQTVRETHENWFTRRVRTTDSPFVVYGRLFTPADMRLANGTSEVPLPPDFFTMRLLEPLLSSTDGTVDDGIVFHPRDLASATYRALFRETGPTSGGTYFYDIVWRLAGPRLLVVPTVALTTTLDLELEYLAAPAKLRKSSSADEPGDSFEGSGFSDIMVDAVRAYAKLEAYRKEGVASHIQLVEGEVTEKLRLVARHAGPRQTVECETVDGFMEDELS